MAATDDARPQIPLDAAPLRPDAPQQHQAEPSGTQSGPTSAPSGEPDMDALIDNFSMDDLIDSIGPGDIQQQAPTATDAIGMPQDDNAAVTQSVHQVSGVLGSAALGAAKAGH